MHSLLVAFCGRGILAMGLFRVLVLLSMVTRAWAGAAEAESGAAPALTMPEAQLEWIGEQVFRNECGAREVCLVHWNSGEDFPSLGIGHFIWYPSGVTGPFRESFPALVAFLAEQGAGVPRWLRSQAPQGAPWPDREAFREVRETDPRVAELRRFLADEKGQQVAFMLERARAALDEVISASREPSETRRKIRMLAATPGGVYALIDYVNFKGEGLAESERYEGVGWGLLQVLEAMAAPAGQADALSAFRNAAASVLAGRAGRSQRPIEREQWLPGWLKRVDTYREPDQPF